MGGAGDSVIAEFASPVEAVRCKIVLEIAGRVPGEFERRDWALTGGRGRKARRETIRKRRVAVRYSRARRRAGPSSNPSRATSMKQSPRACVARARCA